MARATGALTAFWADTMIVATPTTPPAQRTTTGAAGRQEPACRISPPGPDRPVTLCQLGQIFTLSLLARLSWDDAVKSVSYCKIQNASGASRRSYLARGG